MLVIERTKNGQPIVAFKRDWNIGRISALHYERPKQKYHFLDTDACRMQTHIRTNKI